MFSIVLVAQLFSNLCDPMDCNPPGSCVHGILQARIMEWVAIIFSIHNILPLFLVKEKKKKCNVVNDRINLLSLSPQTHPCHSPSGSLTLY